MVVSETAVAGALDEVLGPDEVKSPSSKLMEGKGVNVECSADDDEETGRSEELVEV